MSRKRPKTKQTKSAKRLARERYRAKAKFFRGLCHLFFVAGIFSTLVSAQIYQKTFIDLKILVNLWLLSGLVFTYFTNDFVEKYYGCRTFFLKITFNLVALACITVLLFLFVNSEVNYKGFTEKTYRIRAKNTLTYGRKGRVNSPVVTIQTRDAQKEIEFKNKCFSELKKADKIRLKLKKGNLGFDVILEKTLIIKETRNDMKLVNYPIKNNDNQL